MLISRIDHVSIAVKDQGKAERFFCDILGAIEVARGCEPTRKFAWKIFTLGDLSRLEIISPSDSESFLDGFLEDREGGVHHIILQTPDLHKVTAHLEVQGIPYFGYSEYEYRGEERKEIFIHPCHAFGALIQIAEFGTPVWLSENEKFPPEPRWQVEKTNAGATLIVAHPGGGKVSLDLDREELKQLVALLEKVALSCENVISDQAQQERFMNGGCDKP